MARCRSCGAENPSRLVILFTDKSGVSLKEPVDQCSACHPELSSPEPKLELTPNWVANPQEYDTLEFEDGERIPIVKDWAKGEFENRVAEGPVAQSEMADAIERKRAFARERNKTPLTPAEIEARVNGFRAQFEQAERLMGAQAAGIILP